MVTHVMVLVTLVFRDTSVSLFWTVKWLWRQEEAAATEIFSSVCNIKQRRVNMLKQNKREGRGRKSYIIYVYNLHIR